MLTQEKLDAVAADGLVTPSPPSPARHANRVLGLLLAVLIAPAVQLLPENQAYWAALKTTVAVLYVGLLPGLLLILVVRPVHQLTLLELVAISTVLSLSLTQILTCVSVIFHVPMTGIMVLLTATLVVLVAILSLERWRRSAPTRIVVDPVECALIALLLVLAAVLFLLGSPVAGGEDQIHVAVVRRLAYTGYPAINNIYYTPDFVYTYPFPGTHFFFALISRFGNIDPYFVYHKMRFFWGPAAIIFLYLTARIVYPVRAVALVTVLTALVFVWSGAFADVPGYFWGQLIPNSHASDVAMNVLLPGLLALALYFLTSQTRRSGIFFFVASLWLILMITIVHIREIIQFVVYLIAFLSALVVFARQERGYIVRTSALLVSTVALVVVYNAWHSATVVVVDGLLSERKALLVRAMAEYSLAEWLWLPFRHPNFVFGANTMAYGWNPTILLITPLVFLAFRQHLPMLFVMASVFAYLVIVYVPFVSIAYVYSTYYEILFTPVRNVVCFVYLVTGGLFYLLATKLARLRGTWLPALLALAISCVLGLVWAAWQRFVSWMNSDPSAELWLAGPLVGVYVIALLMCLWPGPERWTRHLHSVDGMNTEPDFVRSGTRAADEPRATWRTVPKWVSILVLLMVPIVYWAWVPTSSPTTYLRALAGGSLPSISDVPSSTARPWPMAPAGTPVELLAQQRCVPGQHQLLPGLAGPFGDASAQIAGMNCPPSYELIRWSHQSLRPDAVLAIDVFNVASPSVYMPQQIVTWPVLDFDPAFIKLNFRAYWDQYDQSMKTRGVPPLFNNVDSLDERLQFMRAFKVTHILVGPGQYELMQGVLGQWPAIFQSIYDDGQWVVFEVQTQ